MAKDRASKVNLLGMLPEDIYRLLEPLGEPPYRARQLFSWVHKHFVCDFEAMTNLPKKLRTWLSEHATVLRLQPAQVLQSSDGCLKMVFHTDAGEVVAVLMPWDDRITLCISSQVGCKMGCTFCLTGRMGFRRNLSASEMVAQVLEAARFVEQKKRITNVVFMGMGEPLDNLKEVIKAVRVITHKEGVAVAPRRTTVSTVGLIPKMYEFAAAGTGAKLAVSLCATTDEVRQKMVPVAKKYRLDDLVAALRDLSPGHGQRHTIEYIMIAGVSDSMEDARRLSKMLSGFPGKVNLIPFNPWPGTPFLSPSERTIDTFCAYLAGKGHVVTVRRSRGQDIGAACGQLGVTNHEERGNTVL